MTEADSAGEALDALEEARAEWLAVALEQGTKIPQPLAAAEYSGKIFARTSPELHRKVVEHAAKEGVSMSQWVSERLANAVGLREGLDELLSRWGGRVVVRHRDDDEYEIAYQDDYDPVEDRANSRG